jgi:hypothetical protein
LIPKKVLTVPARLRLALSGRSQYGVRKFFKLVLSPLPTGISMNAQTSKDPLHGITLEALLTSLVERYGWAELAKIISINCFKSDPSIKSSLKFLRRTPWARQKVEELYIDSLADMPAVTQEAKAPETNPWGKWEEKKPS